jgi:hypothetical protein
MGNGSTRHVTVTCEPQNGRHYNISSQGYGSTFNVLQHDTVAPQLFINTFAGPNQEKLEAAWNVAPHARVVQYSDFVA